MGGRGADVAADGVEDGATPEDGLRKVVPVVAAAMGLRSGVTAAGGQFLVCGGCHWKSRERERGIRRIRVWFEREKGLVGQIKGIRSSEKGKK